MKRVPLPSGSREITLYNKKSFKIKMLVFAAWVRCLFMVTLLKKKNIFHSGWRDNSFALQLLYKVAPSVSSSGYLKVTQSVVKKITVDL